MILYSLNESLLSLDEIRKDRDKVIGHLSVFCKKHPQYSLIDEIIVHDRYFELKIELHKNAA